MYAIRSYYAPNNCILVLAGDFDPVRVARMQDASLEKLLLDPGLIRNRLKIYAVRSNARARIHELFDGQAEIPAPKVAKAILDTLSIYPGSYNFV